MLKDFIWFLAFRWLLLSTVVFRKTTGEKVIIKSGNMITWFRKAFSLTKNGHGEMWQKPNYRNYTTTCGEDTDYVFLTNRVEITDTFADAIYVAIETEYVSQGGNSSQQYNKTLAIYYTNRTITSSQIKDLQKHSKLFYQLFDFLYLTRNETARAKALGNRNRFHVFNFKKKDSKTITFAVRGVSACTRVHSMKLFYYYCKENYKNGVRFPKTPSPLQGWKKVSVNCSANSSPWYHEGSLNASCGYNGTWNISVDTKCLCNKGFQLTNSRGCTSCPLNSFKPNLSNEECKACPHNSLHTKTRTSCQCKNGYYKLPSAQQNDSTTTPCYGLIRETLNISQKSPRKGSVTLHWNKPSVPEPLQFSLHYNVQCFFCAKGKGLFCNLTCEGEDYMPRQSNLKDTFVHISNLTPGNRYVFRVYPKTNLNQYAPKDLWNFTETKPIFWQTEEAKQLPTNKEKSYFDYVIIAGVACGVLFIILIVLITVVIVKRNKTYQPHSILDNHSQVELQCPGQRTYVDPNNYDSPEDALGEFACELDPLQVVLEKLIGGGEFGDVYKGTMKCKNGKYLTVAVKTLKTNSTAKTEKDFLLEASVMGQFHDPNVIHLEGVVTKSLPRMIVTEYMCNGSLDHFLRKNDANFTELQLIGMARGVASGMTYLSGLNFIHRDLAARNILVNADLLCKITDFGLSRALETGGSSFGEYATSGGKIPLRWTAPEAITHRKFTTASDVWSFGILLWETMSFGERPYWEWDNVRVLKEVENGFRLPAPKDCPKAVHNLMLQCWKSNRNERPKFAEITRIMNTWIRSPEAMHNNTSQSTIIADWLRSIKMSDYTPIFLTAGYDHPYQLAGIGDEDLLKMGVKLIGHRNKILKAVRTFDDSKFDEDVKLTRVASIAV